MVGYDPTTSGLQNQCNYQLCYRGKFAELLTRRDWYSARREDFQSNCTSPYYRMYPHHLSVATPIIPIEFLCPSWVFKRKAVGAVGLEPTDTEVTSSTAKPATNYGLRSKILSRRTDLNYHLWIGFLHCITLCYSCIFIFYCLFQLFQRTMLCFYFNGTKLI